jgi:hypothetical protein
VYVVEAEVLGGKYRGMTNIGLRPTVGGSFTTIETHILDFDEDIYGLPLRITFLRRLRDEVRFPSLEALTHQLEKDRDCCREINKLLYLHVPEGDDRVFGRRLLFNGTETRRNKNDKLWQLST